MSKKPLTKIEKKHLEKVKELPCGNCEHDGPSFAHHITQCGRRIGHFATIPLCFECHSGKNGIHGDRVRWIIAKNNESKVLEQTMRVLLS